MNPRNFKLRIDPDPLLYQKIENFDFNQDYDLDLIEKSMIHIMNSFDGIGISANQVGFDRRVIVVKPKGQSPFAMFNPKIIEIGNMSIPDREGCLSFPNLFLTIERPDSIKVEYIDKNKNTCIMLFENYDAKCVQHELDHLDGICFTKKISVLKLSLAKKRSRKLNGRTK